jgi:transposase
MGRPIGPKNVHHYSAEFKLTAVKLSKMPGVEVQTVAAALDIHPFMLSRWRKEAREGILRGKAKRIEVAPRRAREIKRLQALEWAHAILKAEHNF